MIRKLTSGSFSEVSLSWSITCSSTLRGPSRSSMCSAYIRSSAISLLSCRHCAQSAWMNSPRYYKEHSRSGTSTQWGQR